jgi:predicted tellurium resistance membrane protein TerC
MRSNSANRSFVALAGTTLLPYALLGMFSCGLVSLVVIRLASDGLSGLHDRGQDLRPAAAFTAMLAGATVIADDAVRLTIGHVRRFSVRPALATAPAAPHAVGIARRNPNR